jgi:acetyltransferase-like isoleucine patch superfamily enzyme
MKKSICELKSFLRNRLPDEVFDIYNSFLVKRIERRFLVPEINEVLFVGKHSYGRENIKILFRNSGHIVRVGNFSSIGPKLTIFSAGGFHRTEWVSMYPFGHVYLETFGAEKFEQIPVSKGDVSIGNDVWIGQGATIMSGVTIGDGAVIAANSHVVTDVPDYAIVGGNPAILIRYRFEPALIVRLKEIRWWDFPDNLVNANKALICQTPSEDTLRALQELRWKLDNPLD